MRSFYLSVPYKRDEIDVKLLGFDGFDRVHTTVNDDGSYHFEYEGGAPSKWDDYSVDVIEKNNKVIIKGIGERKFRAEILDNLYWLKKALKEENYNGLIYET